MADSVSQEAVEFVQQVSAADGDNRTKGLEDLRFRFGDQWPADMITARGARPRLTINETDAYCRQITNALREQRPRIKAYAANTLAQKKTAEVITGLMRHFQVNSDADNAYDLAGEFAVTMGWGYWRVLYDYVREDSFDQDVFIKQIENPFSVYFDPNSNEPDGSDAEKALITDKMPIEAFKRDFPGAKFDNFTATSAGDSMSDWVSKEDIRIAEYFRVIRTRAKLVALSNGMAIWEDEMPPAELLKANGLTVKGDRESYKRKVTWHKVTAMEELEAKNWAGRWIPIVPTYGSVIVIDGKRTRMGAVRFARDPQKMVNYWNTNVTEVLAMAPKPKYILVEGMDEGHENEWARANTDATATLHVKMTDLAGQAVPPDFPRRVAPEPPPQGLLVAAGQASLNLQKVMGMFDPETNSTNPKSGKAIRAESQQSERSNYHFYDNQTRSMKHTGRICIDLVRKIMDVYRVACIIGEDGKPDLVEINKPNPRPQIDPAEGQAIASVLNDVRVGEYGVIMDVGPGYNSKRQEAADALGPILAADHELMSVIGDLYFRNLDFPGAEVIADRLASQNPLAQIDEKSDIPPQAQMALKALQEKLKQAMQQLQEAGVQLKFRGDIEKMRQEGENTRALMKETARAHDIETTAATRRQDVDTRAVTAQNVEEIRALALLLSKHLDTQDLEREIAARNAEQQRQAAQAEAVATPA